MKPITILCAIMLVFLCAVSYVGAGEVGRITYTEGRVDIFPAGAETAAAAADGSAINVGDSVRVKSNSKAEIVFADSSRMRIAENSKVTVTDYRLNADNSRAGAAIKLERGKMRTIIAKSAAGAPFDILTPNASGRVKGSDVYSSFQMGNSGMLVAEGALAVSTAAQPGTVITIPAGNAVLVPPDGQAKGPRQYLDMELKFYEKDTEIPETVFRREGITFIRGRLDKVAGNVKLTDRQGVTRDARPGDTIEEGCRIVTGIDGMAEIVFDNGNAMTLKSGTSVSVLKLVIDPKTGEYENLFQTDGGQIKSRIEKLRGKSKFEIKTPTALCGARGTIMYLMVGSDGSTNAFFEGGNGYATSTLTGNTQDIGAGEGSSVNSDGSITAPQPTSEEQRAELDESWGGGSSGGDGSSSGDSGGFLFDSGAGSDGGEGGGAGTIDELTGETAGGDSGTGDTGTTVDVPITEVIPGEDPAGTSTGAAMGSFQYSDAVTPTLVHGGDLYDIAAIVDTAALWLSNPGSPVPISVTGVSDITTPFEFLVWTTDAFYPYDDAAGTSTTSDGGSYYCILGGYRGGGTLEGLIVGLYIDPAGYAGTIAGDVTGIDETNFTLSGTASVTQHASTFDVMPQDLVSTVEQAKSLCGSGSLLVGGTDEVIASVESGTTLEIASTMGKGWGVWAVTMAGSYVQPVSVMSPFDLEIAGMASSTTSGEPDGPWLQVMKVSSWSANRLGATMDGIYLGVHDDGTMSGGKISGKAIGSYVDVPAGEVGGWQAVGCGEWIDVNPAIDISNMTTLTTDIQNLNPAAVPITVAESSLMSGPGAFANGTTMAVSSMNINFFESVAGANNGIWAALVSGTFDTAYPRVDTWSVTVNDGAAGTATLTGTQWSGGNWKAEVNGTSDGARTFNGTAAGTYSDGTGTFSGAGAGQWESAGGQIIT